MSATGNSMFRTVTHRRLQSTLMPFVATRKHRGVLRTIKARRHPTFAIGIIGVEATFRMFEMKAGIFSAMAAQ